MKKASAKKASPTREGIGIAQHEAILASFEAAGNTACSEYGELLHRMASLYSKKGDLSSDLLYAERAYATVRALDHGQCATNVRQHAVGEILLADVYMRLGRTTESLAAADRAVAFLELPGCMDTTANCSATTVAAPQLVHVGRS